MQAGLARLVIRGPVEHAILEISGELDFSDAATVAQAVAAMPDRLVEVDVSGLEFVDGAGVRVLREIVGRPGPTGDRPKLVGASPQVLRALALVRLHAGVGVGDA